MAPVVCVQNSYGLGSGQVDPLVRACAEQGIAFVPFFALAGTGREQGRTGAEPGEVLAVAREHDASAAQIQLAWTLHQGPHILAIPVTGSPDHLAENVAAGAIRLSPDQLDSLESLHRSAVPKGA